MSATPPAVEVHCPACGALLARTSGPDGLAIGAAGLHTVTVRSRRTVRLECRCGHALPWHGAGRGGSPAAAGGGAEAV